MNDAERDAWLREALRHAPDADAVPPSGVSETILAKARAQARAGAAGRRTPARASSATGFAAFWDWLARPPVAASFASVMAATLVGVMWWDRPMDEAMPRPPAATEERSNAAPPRDVAPPRAEAASPPIPAPSNEAAKLTAQDRGALQRQRSELKHSPMADAKVAEPAPAAEKRKLDSLAKESSAGKNEAAAPFPATPSERESRAAASKSLDAATAEFAKKADDARRSPATDAVERAATPPVAQSVAPGFVARPAPPQAAAAPAAPAAPAATTTAPQAGAAPFGQPGERQRAVGALREKDEAGAAAGAPSQSATRADIPARPGAGSAAAATPLARIIAAIAADPDGWSRRAASGEAVALDAGWRAWLTELDAAAAGRWRPLEVGGAAAGNVDAARDGATTTLRLISAGRIAAVIRVEGASVQVDAAPGTGAERWQAALAPAGAERLRTTSRRLVP